MRRRKNYLPLEVRNIPTRKNERQKNGIHFADTFRGPRFFIFGSTLYLSPVWNRKRGRWIQSCRDYFQRRETNANGKLELPWKLKLIKAIEELRLRYTRREFRISWEKKRNETLRCTLPSRQLNEPSDLIVHFSSTAQITHCSHL